MIRLIQHISVSLWLGFWAGMPVIFTTIDRLQIKFPDISPETLAAAVFMGISVCISLGCTIFGRILIQCRLREGMTWEQKGIQHRAARQYEKAIALYDSFLLFPFFDKSLGKTLIHSLTVFSLSHVPKKHFFHPQIASLYLKNHPRDTELARLWLDQFPTKNSTMKGNTLPLETLSRLARVHKDHKILGPMILKVFLKLGRTDYPAMQLYRHMLERPDLAQNQRKGIYRLVGRESQKLSGSFMQENWDQMSFDHTFQNLFELSKGEKRSGRYSGRARTKSQKTFRAVAAGMVLAIFSGMFTIICLTPSRPLLFFLPAQKSLVSQGYAIQLGAFLEKVHAEELAQQIQKRQSKPVEIRSVKGGNKTWQVIRIQGFSSKDAAEEYGNALKAEGIIKDFFVCTAKEIEVSKNKGNP